MVQLHLASSSTRPVFSRISQRMAGWHVTGGTPILRYLLGMGINMDLCQQAVPEST